MALPAHERKAEVLKDLEEIRPKLHTNVKFRRNKAKVSLVLLGIMHDEVTSY